MTPIRHTKARPVLHKMHILLALFIIGYWFIFSSQAAYASPTSPPIGRPVTQTFDVITIEYPPFISSEAPDNGTASVLLNRWIAQERLPLSPALRFLPPARAYQLVNGDDWCTSFFPPLDRDSRPFQAIADREVKIKFARRKNDAPFRWSNLKSFAGKQIALLRPIGRPGRFSDYAEAGAILVFVDSVDQGMGMLARGRVDYAMIDDFKFREEFENVPGLPELELSENTLETATFGLYVGPQCETLFPPQNKQMTD